MILGTPRKARKRACLTLVVFAGALGCTSQLFLQPDASRRHARGSPTASAETIEIRNAAGNELRAMLLAAPGDHGTVMVSGGNGMGRYQTFRYTGFLHGHGFRVLTFSFQGYDDNGGDASLGSLLGDAVGFYEVLQRRFRGEPIVYVASSISTAPALCLPSRKPELAGVILEGTINLRTISFAKLRDMRRFWLLAPLTLPFAAGVSASIPSELSPRRCAGSAGAVPALFLHHPRDLMASYGGARGLYDDYAGPKRFEALDGRNSRYHLLLDRDRHAQAIALDAIHDWLAGPRNLESRPAGQAPGTLPSGAARPIPPT